ncbi:peptidoglycan editing factor PgeF [Arcobacter sp. F2176]|uniref:peptidoglycan editing factor PgeF n=1 Tax=Arcobacter sp. F2176 TaxID=2044511 RepID=UPI00100BC04D|nr:peptidoglycan editing factor PgeF [Arcobacter sp. F2176]RXJ82800.1 multicopper polyphenol oxidase [Arcobacter sp. F2176]
MDTILKFTTTIIDGNMAYHVNDAKSSVDKNRLELSKKHNFDISKLRYMNQVHADNIEIVDFESPLLIDNCDALITKERNLPIMVMVADCIPIFLSDENKKVIAVVHAGRNSTFLKIVQKTALKMIEELDCKAKDIFVYLGPSIQKCCYEVSEELETIAIKSFGKEFCQNRYLDLQGINIKQLNDIGIFNIELSAVCTKCSEEAFFSYRKDKNCGRFSIVGIIK